MYLFSYFAAMQLPRFIGQDATWQKLIHLARQNRLSHAFLFLGREGSGALPLAVSFARFILCERNSPYALKKNEPVADLFAASPSLFGEEPASAAPVAAPSEVESDQGCGTCPSCLKVNQLAHPDLHFTIPVIPKNSGDKPVSNDYMAEWREFFSQHPYGNVYDWLQFIKAENKQGNITSDECHEINRKLSLKSFEGPFKILILWMPEYLKKEGNRLLKLIEEPPPNTLFFLVGEQDELILPTILSRTQLIKVPALSDDEIAAALVARAGFDAEKARQIAALSEGNYREALMLQSHADEDWHLLLRDWLNHIVKRNHPAQVKWIEEMARQGRENQKQFLRYFTHQLQLAVRLQAGNNEQVLKPDVEFAAKLNKLCSIPQLEAIIQELDKSVYYIERNANAKMLFSALCIRLYHIICNNSLILVH